MKCSYCKKEIEFWHGEYILWGCDGDFVCNQKCYDAMREEMNKVCNMSNKEFYDWMGVTE